MADPKSNQMRVKITDETLKGVYANQMVVSHTKEEFLLDFVNVFPPEGIVNARIIISPGHLKRVIRALVENVRKYEDHHGEIPEAAEPGRGEIN
jgi:signal transduction histidine kinase